MLPDPVRRRPVTVLAAVIALLSLPGPVAAVPSTVLPGDVDGAEVALDPAVLRAPAGTADVDVVLGSDAPGDVIVELELRTARTDTAGVVTPGPEAAGATATTGGRLHPGERLRVRVTVDPHGPPVVVVAQVRGATSPTSTEAPGAPVELTALVLPGAPPAAPQVTVAAGDGRVTGTVTADGPLLVAVRLAGAASTTHPDRLVLPDQPVVVAGDAARWPVPSVVSVTDEEGRTATADTGRGALAGLAALLLVVALGLVLLVGRQRRRRTR